MDAPSGPAMGISVRHMDFLSANGARAQPWQNTEMPSAYYVCCIYIPVHFRLDFIMGVNSMNPDQTAPKQSDLGPYCLQYRPPKSRSK